MPRTHVRWQLSYYSKAKEGEQREIDCHLEENARSPKPWSDFYTSSLIASTVSEQCFAKSKLDNRGQHVLFLHPGVEPACLQSYRQERKRGDQHEVRHPRLARWCIELLCIPLEITRGGKWHLVNYCRPTTTGSNGLVRSLEKKTAGNDSIWPREESSE